MRATRSASEGRQTNVDSTVESSRMRTPVPPLVIHILQRVSRLVLIQLLCFSMRPPTSPTTEASTARTTKTATGYDVRNANILEDVAYITILPAPSFPSH